MKKDKTLKTAKDVFKTTLGLASAVLQAEPTGIGKTMVDSVLFMVNEFEKTVDNAETGRELLIDFKRLTDGLQNAIPANARNQASSDLQIHVNELLSELHQISESCHVAKGNFFERMIRRDEDAGTLLKVAPRLNQALQVYQTKAIIRIEQGVHDLQRNSDNDRLRDILRPSAAASYNSDREVSIGICADGTRTQLLHDIIEWALSDDPDSSVYLINGMAGLGKSTIAKTIAERVELRNRLGATFFFSRREGAELRNARGVIPTLAYQLARRYPPFKAEVLDRSRDDEPTDWMSIPLDVQLKRLYNILQSTTTFTHPPLIILDAFDECEWPGSQSLLSLLLAMAFPRSPSKPVPLKFLITSRPEIDLISVFNRYCQRKEYILHEMDNTLARHDINLYLEQSLLRIPSFLSLGNLPSRWFDDSDLVKLTDAAGSFFIYAATAVRIVEDRRVRNPKAQLKSLLAAKGSSSVRYPMLDTLYLSILLPTMMCTNPDLALGQYQTVVGAVTFLRDRLSLAAISRLLDMETEDVTATLVPLQSIIIVPSEITQPPTIYHASFIDFVTSDRCVEERLRLVESDRERHLAVCCLKIMTGGLALNIAKVPNPGVDVAAIPGLAQRILPEIAYSVRYWASHLSGSPHDDKELIRLVDDIGSRCLLWWIEVCGILGYLDAAIDSCRRVLIWLKSSTSSVNATSLFNDASRLMMAHGGTLTSNPLQLYASILPIIPYDTLLSRTYLQPIEIPHLIVCVGRDHQWPGHLAAWTSHTDGVLSAAFSSDGLQAVSGSHDKTVCIWDVALGRCTSVLEGHTNSVRSVAFSPNGMQVVSGSDDYTVRLWDVALGRCTSVLDGLTHPVKSVAFSPDGTRLVSGSSDGTVRLWDVALGSCTFALGGHEGPVNSVAFSPDGTQVVSGAHDDTVRLWDVTLGRCASVLEGHQGDVNSVAFSPTGMQVVSGSEDNTIRLWDLALGSCTSVLGGPTSTLDPDPDHSVNTVAFSPDGTRVVSGANDKTARIWDVELGCCTIVLEGHGWSVNSVMFSPDGMRVISGSSDSTICIWDAAVKGSHTLPQGHNDWVESVAFSPDGTHVVSGSDDNTVRVWDVKLGKCTVILEGHTSWVKTVAFSPDGTHVVSGSYDKAVRVWNVKLGSCTATLKGRSSPVKTVAFSSDSAYVVSRSVGETIRIWDFKLGSCITVPEGHTGTASPVPITPDGTRLSSHSIHENLEWQMNSDGCWQQRNSSTIPHSSNPSKPRTQLTSMPDRWLGHFNSDGSPTRICRLPSRIIAESPTAFHGALMAAGSKDGTVTVLDVSALLPLK